MRTLNAGDVRWALRLGSTDLDARAGSAWAPMHPVTLYIDSRKAMTLHADDHGSVSYLIKPSALGLRPGRHVVDLARMLITTTDAFRST